MSSWTQYTFFVDDIHDRMKSMRSNLTVVDRMWESRATRITNEGEETRVPVITLRSVRFSICDTETVNQLFDLALQPGEVGGRVGASDTTDSGGVSVYRKDSTGELKCLGDFEGEAPGDRAKPAFKRAEDVAGIRPIYREHESDRKKVADPYWFYRVVFDSECLLYKGDTPEIEAQDVSNPDTACSCGGVFEPRELQYPGLASIIYECQECGELTTNLHSLDPESFSPITFRDAPGDDVTANLNYRLTPEHLHGEAKLYEQQDDAESDKTGSQDDDLGNLFG